MAMKASSKGLDIGEAQLLAALVLQLEFVNPDFSDAAVLAPFQPETVLGQRLQAHVLKDRQDVRQGHEVGDAVELHPEGQLGIVRLAIGPDTQGVGAAFLGRRQGLDHLQIVERFGGGVAVAVAGGEGLGIAAQHFAHPPAATPPARASDSNRSDQVRTCSAISVSTAARSGCG